MDYNQGSPSSTSSSSSSMLSQCLEEEKSSSFCKITCAIVGDSASGKSCLIQSLLHNNFIEDYAPTVFEVYDTQEVITDQSNDQNYAVQIKILDMGGGEEYEHMRQIVFSTVDVFLVTFDVFYGKQTLRRAKYHWIPEIRKVNDFARIILCGCKTDKGIRMKPISERRKQRMGCDELLVCSSKTRNGVSDVSKCMARFGAMNTSLSSILSLSERHSLSNSNTPRETKGATVDTTSRTRRLSISLSGAYSSFMNAIYGTAQSEQSESNAGSETTDIDKSLHIPKLPLNELKCDDHRIHRRLSMTWGGRSGPLYPMSSSPITRRRSDGSEITGHVKGYDSARQQPTQVAHSPINHSNGSMSAREAAIKDQEGVMVRSMRRLSLNLSNLFSAPNKSQETSS